MGTDSTATEPVSESGQTQERGLRILRVSTHTFAEMFMAGEHPGYRVIDNALPKDVQIRNCRLGWPDASPPYPDVIELLLESAEFIAAKEGEPIPLLVPILDRLFTPE
jgi:hypothetical protein